MKKSIIILIILAAAGLVAAQWIWAPHQSKEYNRKFSEKINLALRQTGHHLLLAAGNDTSAIKPVKQIDNNEFVLRLDQAFDYDTLPYLMKRAFNDFGITSPYYVAIKNCETDSVVLGYNLSSVEKNEITCLGRDQKSDCNLISVTFTDRPIFKSNQLLVTAIFGLLCVLTIGQFFYQRNLKKEAPAPNLNVEEGVIKIGASDFHFKNQYIFINGEKTELTFRENKLLHYFSIHPNMVLEREKILSEVWEDEGVIVGRSLDVFVSRLRKVLSADPSLSIKNVHGVGYRFEIVQ
jgi:hypothetical protein